MKRITDARIERTTAVLEMIQMLDILVERMIDLRLYSRDLLNTLESSAYATLSLKAERLLEMIQKINPAPAKGDCEWTELNMGDLLC